MEKVVKTCQKLYNEKEKKYAEFNQRKCKRNGVFNTGGEVVSGLATGVVSCINGNRAFLSSERPDYRIIMWKRR